MSEPSAVQRQHVGDSALTGGPLLAEPEASGFPAPTLPAPLPAGVAIPWPHAAPRRLGPWRDSLRRRLLALGDLTTAALVASFLAVVPGGSLSLAFWALASAPVWVLLAKLQGLYEGDERSLRHLTVDELPKLFVWALTSIVATVLVVWAAPVEPPTVGVAVACFAVAVAAAITLRVLARSTWRRIVPRERAVIIGSGPLADETRRKLELFPDIHVDVAGQHDERAAEDGAADDVLAEADRVILASQSVDEALIARLLQYCRANHVKLSMIPPVRGMFGTAVRLHHVADLPVVEYSTWSVSRSTLLLKRWIDVALAATALVVLTPLFLAVAVAVRVESRGPAIFRQQRAGRDGRPFRMLKFRTMVADAEERLPQLVPFESLGDPMFKLRNDPRVTRVGRVLRRTSIDELPQLLNVLRGQMSLVGPRPEQADLVERYRPEHRFRLLVRPGMTGPMQVFGRGELTFEERLAVEREYIENLSLGRDVRILAMTVSAVAHAKGAF
jgi:exopolysaccharide biosynthesis polyprenyl glycosylphosphotransferase